MEIHEQYMLRCFDLARLGAGKVSPNPMVGAVVVYDHRIIGEGYHHQYGNAHAEVDAINNIAPQDFPLLSKATLYVSLEPCCIFGKTPPCTRLILEKKIPKVVISCLDLTPEVAGNGVQILRDAGVEVVTGVLEKEGKELSAIRNTFAAQHRPYTILKYAQSEDGFMGKPKEQVWITHPYSKRLVHRWRHETDAILVGTHTAQIDNPQLNNRHYYGKSPIRIVLDRQLSLPFSLSFFDHSAPTWIVTEKNNVPTETDFLKFINIPFDHQFLPTLLRRLAEEKITSLLVEGGQKVLESFIAAQLWDEARILVGKKIMVEGLLAPKIPFPYRKKYDIGQDKLLFYRNICKKE